MPGWALETLVCVFVHLSQSLSVVFAVDELTISVSDTGPKLVTKMFVLISVTFSVEREQMETGFGGQRETLKRQLFTKRDTSEQPIRKDVIINELLIIISS